MNAKKAKRIRQLVQHLQTKGAINENWELYGNQQHTDVSSDLSVPKMIIQPTKMLDPACGKAVYKQMKQRAIATGRA